jgi:predicted deacylase
MVDCAHPERPSRWVLLGAETAEELKVEVKGQTTAAVRVPMAVLAGEAVRVWRRDGMASIETSGVAERSGAVGARIRVRLVRRGVDGESVERHETGVVDGVGSVELR